MKLTRFWEALEELGPRAASRKYFQNRLAEEFPAVERFIVQDAAPESVRLALPGYPCERCGRSHAVEPAGPDVYRAISEDDEERTPCLDIEGLTSNDVWPRRYDFERLGRAVAMALAIAPDFRARCGGMWAIGATESGRLPVFLCIQSSDADYRKAADAVRAEIRGEFLFLTATHRARAAERFGRNSGACYSLSDVIEFGRDGNMSAVAPADRIIAMGLPRSQPAGTRRALAMRGRRYRIEDGYLAIARLKPKPQRYRITALTCREALRVLVDGGHGSEETAIHKRDWCRSVWRARTPERPSRGDEKPIQFFRVRRGEKTVMVSWYKNVISTDGRGMYWLNL